LLTTLEKRRFVQFDRTDAIWHIRRCLRPSQRTAGGHFGVGVKHRAFRTIVCRFSEDSCAKSPPN
jgi:hypothetical protein